MSDMDQRVNEFAHAWGSVAVPSVETSLHGMDKERNAGFSTSLRIGRNDNSDGGTRIPIRPLRVRMEHTALAMGLLCVSACAQMHKVAAPEKVTRAVGVYEYVGDPMKPKAARLIPVSLFIGGHFEDAGVYLARPVPFALDSGLRYELQVSGVPKDVLDLVASRDFANSAVAANLPFEDGWFGYGRVSAPKVAKAGRVRANCGNAHVVEEASKDDGKPHFGSKAGGSKSVDPKTAAAAIPKECIEEEPEAKVTVDDYGKKDKDAADPERPTLHRSPESSAHNTGADARDAKGKKKDNKPPAATVVQNGGPGGDDPDRPTIRHRTTDEDDPNALPPDPLELASRSSSPAASSKPSTATDARSAANETVAEGGSISSGDTMSGGPVLRRGKLTAAKDDVQAVVKPTGVPVAAAVAAPLDAMVAVSDAKDRQAHNFAYTFASATERAAALSQLEAMALEVVKNPTLATDAPVGTVAPVAAAVKAPASVRSRSGRPVKPKAVTAVTPLQLVDEAMGAYQLYFSAPVSYTFFARVPASATVPERFVTVVASTDPDGSLHAAMRTVTDSMHLDRVPRYRPIDVVDADGSNRASILMELRAQRSRTFALYRLLGNRTDQVYVSGSTLL